MIREMFRKDQAHFVRFADDHFQIGARKRERLRGSITDMIPMRKRFESGKLVCWSGDAVHGRYGQRCALCRERMRCAERLRLMLLLEDLEREPTPAILEIGHGSFDALETFVQGSDSEDLTARTVTIGMHRANGRLRFTFQPAD